MREEHEAVIEPGIDERAWNTLVPYQPAEEDIGVKDDAHRVRYREIVRIDSARIRI